MKKVFLVLILIVLAFVLLNTDSVFAATKETAKKVSKVWSALATLENSGNSGFPGVTYQKTYDSEFEVVCYTAKFSQSIAISCVEK